MDRNSVVTVAVSLKSWGFVTKEHLYFYSITPSHPITLTLPIFLSLSMPVSLFFFLPEAFPFGRFVIHDEMKRKKRRNAFRLLLQVTFSVSCFCLDTIIIYLGIPSVNNTAGGAAKRGYLYLELIVSGKFFKSVCHKNTIKPNTEMSTIGYYTQSLG